MKVGTLTLNHPFILAPLAGYTDLPFRLLCREHGADLCFSEMISCHGLVFQQKKTLAYLATVPEERPVAFQLFGSDPEIMGRAAAILAELPIDMIDINMGCPVKKVTRKGAGVALMKEPALAARIIEAVCKNSRGIPVSVKIRSGWNEGNRNCVEFALMAEGSGAALITVHGRTWSQFFSGTSDWEMIARVKDAVSVPVVGNGDILCHGDGIRMMEQTGCDGVMIGRAALGNPWIFSPEGMPETLRQRILVLRRHLDLASRHQDMASKLAVMKNHGGKYIKGLAGSSTVRKSIYDCKSYSELSTLISGLMEEEFSSHP